MADRGAGLVHRGRGSSDQALPTPDADGPPLQPQRRGVTPGAAHTVGSGSAVHTLYGQGYTLTGVVHTNEPA